MYYARAMRNRPESCQGNSGSFLDLTPNPHLSRRPSPENATVSRLFCYRNRICHLSNRSAPTTYEFYPSGWLHFPDLCAFAILVAKSYLFPTFSIPKWGEGRTNPEQNRIKPNETE